MTWFSKVAAVSSSLNNLLDSVESRALPNAPNGYTPANVGCPVNKPMVRNAARLSINETTWLQTRRQETVFALKGLFGHLNMSFFNAVSYLESHASNISNIPIVGIAVSGGGYRALANGAGALKALDSRTSGTTQMGGLGGLLQSATYLSGLSGGSW
jgi:lysophospholipase